jgi:hypothetical protein
VSEFDSSRERSLRVFEAAIVSPQFEFDLEVELPLAWARRHDSLVVGFDFDSVLGWHARLVGDDGHVLLNFPWYDHVDRSLGGARRTWYRPWAVAFIDELPTSPTDEGWDDLDQGWWGRVIPDGADVYIAETDHDEITSAPPGRVVLERPGHVFVNGVLVTWSCVTRELYDRAWREAIESCRRGRPSPVGERIDLPVSDPETGAVSHASRFSFASPSATAEPLD